MLNQAVGRIAWVTDPHFNFVKQSDWQPFVDRLVESAADLILLGGDISEADDFTWHVQRLSDATQIPIAYVLGNHDYYRGSISTAQAHARGINVPNKLVYLTGDSPIRLCDRWTLIGDDCPADARAGNPRTSPVQMNDFNLIEEFQGLEHSARITVMRALGDEAARRLKQQLSQAAAHSDNILVLSHAPPMREACWHEGQVGDDDWAPYFVCQAAGDALKSFCAGNPQCQVLVLCGHTHSSGVANVAPNLTIRTGAAVYGEPQITELIHLDQL
ncbi:MAG: metallophosphoesterase [Aureliella sp.]